MNYKDLVDKLQDLEGLWNGNSTQPLPQTPSRAFIEVKDNVQYFACDTGTSKCGDLPVVVAIGINYSQGKNCLPSLATRSCASSAPWVEDDLHTLPNNRGALESYFQNYSRNPKAWFYNCLASNTAIRLPGKDAFHLVATNLCPWITQRQWSNKGLSEPIRADILVHPPGFSPVRPLFQHLDQLASVLGSESVVWVGHGLDAVSQLFRVFTEKHAIPNWLITQNLSMQPKEPRLPVAYPVEKEDIALDYTE